MSTWASEVLLPPAGFLRWDFVRCLLVPMRKPYSWCWFRCLVLLDCPTVLWWWFNCLLKWGWGEVTPLVKLLPESTPILLSSLCYTKYNHYLLTAILPLSFILSKAFIMCCFWRSAAFRISPLATSSASLSALIDIDLISSPIILSSTFSRWYC